VSLLLLLLLLLQYHSLKPDGKVDPSSQHGSCPTLKGTKWSATKWIHIYPLRRNRHRFLGLKSLCTHSR
jgi:prolyl 4-hydroxylase